MKLRHYVLMFISMIIGALLSMRSVAEVAGQTSAKSMNDVFSIAVLNMLGAEFSLFVASVFGAVTGLAAGLFIALVLRGIETVVARMKNSQ